MLTVFVRIDYRAIDRDPQARQALEQVSRQADSDHRRATKTIAAALPEVTEQDIHSPQP